MLLKMPDVRLRAERLWGAREYYCITATAHRDRINSNSFHES